MTHQDGDNAPAASSRELNNNDALCAIAARTYSVTAAAATILAAIAGNGRCRRAADAAAATARSHTARQVRTQ